jgi:hypothetical protein
MSLHPSRQLPGRDGWHGKRRSHASIIRSIQAGKVKPGKPQARPNPDARASGSGGTQMNLG